ncbi:hypothetical protein [Streptomyces sp. NPDC006691]|uniref:hypothetical protein n=1 Tax=Streptomyces sp. NPDC006691 TaxID=3364757 RepID=UPI00367E4286
MHATGGLMRAHVENAVERGLSSAREAVERGMDAGSVAAWPGQTSACHRASLAPDSGGGLAHRYARDFLAAWCARHSPRPAMWRTVHSLIGDFPSTLPDLLRAADRRAGR